MDGTRKNVVFAGLGRYVSKEYEMGEKLGIQKSNRQIVLDLRPTRELERTQQDLTCAKEIEKASAAGYELSSMDVDPDQPEESIRRLKELLQNRPCDLLIIDFGLRSNPALTPLFEQAVNTCVELSPSTKLGFAPAPNEMFQTILRLLT